VLIGWGCAVVAAVAASVAGCGGSAKKADTPGLAERGTTMTTAKPTRQDLANRVSLSGKVNLDPVFGLVAPVGGQVRYLTVTPPKTTPTKPTRVAGIWSGGKATYVEIPAGSLLAGRLVDDKATVVAGTPIIAAKHVGYGIVADIDATKAYQIAEAPSTARAQIKNGPGPFDCGVLGTIAALPAGTVPQAAPSASPSGQPADGSNQQGDGAAAQGSESTGMRLVCIPPGDVKMINGVAVTVEIVTATAKAALVLPVEAVAGTQGKGKVDVLRADGTKETRDVVLGLTDGKVVEIRSGLTGDETVAVPGPNLPTAAPEPEGGSRGPGVVVK
jgi:hypothetical protein